MRLIVYTFVLSFYFTHLFAFEFKTAEDEVGIKTLVTPKEGLTDIKKIVESEDPTMTEEKSQISNIYLSGNHLIYDCIKKHFACVDAQSFNNCYELRIRAISYKEHKKLPCAPLKKFKIQKECHDQQYILQRRRRAKKFCYLDSSG